METVRPRAVIRNQVQTSKPVRDDGTIMDDTVMTMDGTALMGGPTVTIPMTRQSIENIRPTAIIHQRR